MQAAAANAAGEAMRAGESTAPSFQSLDWVSNGALPDADAWQKKTRSLKAVMRADYWTPYGATGCKRKERPCLAQLPASQVQGN